MTIELIKNNREYILYDDASVEAFAASWFENGGESFVGGRVPVIFFRVGDEEYVLKHYARGGLPARLSVDKYLYLNQRRVRSFMEWRFLRCLRQNHLPVPAPIAARYQRCGRLYTADLITRSCRPARPLSDILKERSVSAEEWCAVGATIRQFHDCGVDHPDLNVANLLLDEENQHVVLLDFDKAKQGKISRKRQTANLRRLRRSLDKLCIRHPSVRVNTAHFQSLYAGWRS